MSTSDYHLSSSAIKRLEETSASLATAIESHLSMCQSLGADLLREGAKPEEVAASIDSTLVPVHIAMSRNLDEAGSVVKRTRNEFTSPVFRFPPEVISEIFTNAVFDPRDSEAPNPQRIPQHIRLIYRRLHRLLGVCSTWRNILISMGVLWSIVPIVEGMPTQWHDLFQLRLKRAGENKLYLVTAVESWRLEGIPRFLTPRYHRFHAINISSEDRITINYALNVLLQQRNFGSLSELSVQLKPRGALYGNKTISANILLDEHRENSIKDLIGGLTVFRISGITFPSWGTMPFSTRLVELRVDHANLGLDGELVQFIRALSSASELRDLKIISVETHDHEGSDTITPPPVAFPKLQSLYIQDVYFNTLKTLLSMITPGSHRLTLYLTKDTLRADLRVDHNDWSPIAPSLSYIDITKLCTILRSYPVHTLMMNRGLDSEKLWLSSSMFVSLLEAMPTLTTLKMHRWHFDKAVRTDLNRRRHPQLPGLENLHLTSASISDANSLRDMMATHPLRQVVLGGTIVYTRSDNNEPIRHQSFWDNSIVQSLRGSVPDFCLVDSAYRSPDFDLGEWRLW